MKYKDFKLPVLPVDVSLTPENALEKGYEYQGDAIYDCEAPYIAMKDILDLVELKNYKLGISFLTPKYKANGLYKPLM